MAAVTVQLDPQSPDLTISLELPAAGACVRWVKEELCKQDPTGAAQPESFQLCAVGKPGVLLDDGAPITAELKALMLCTDGGKEEEVAAQADLSSIQTGDVSSMQNLARGGAIGPGRVLFRGQPFWQELLPEHVTKAGNEFHVALDTGRNLARIPSNRHDRNPRPLPEDDPAYIAAAVCIDDGQPAQDDEAEVEKAVKQASSWGDRVRLRRLLVSCWVPARICCKALCEASMRGHEEIVAEMLRAKVAPSSNDGESRKTALHFACENGHEGVAKLLLTAKAELNATDATGRTPCELAREQDLGMLAKRLEKAFA